MGWRDLAGNTKRYAGSTGTVVVPKGASIVYLQFSGGTVTGFPDGSGGTITITSPASNYGNFTYIPMHVQGTDGGGTITFSGTTQYFLELYIPAAEGSLP